MTKEELKQEAIKASDKKCVKGCSKYYRYGFQDGYIAGAEPREKQIQIDAEQIRALQKQNGELTDKVKELEAQLAKSVYLMKELMIDIDTPAYGYAVSQANKFIKEIKEK